MFSKINLDISLSPIYLRLVTKEELCFFLILLIERQKSLIHLKFLGMFKEPIPYFPELLSEQSRIFNITQG